MVAGMIGMLLFQQLVNMGMITGFVSNHRHYAAVYFLRRLKYVVVYDSAGDRVPDEFRKQEPADALAQTPVPMLKMQKMIGAVTNQENKKKP